MRSTPYAFYAFAALLMACGCSAPKAPEPLIAGGGVGGTGMAVVESNRTREIDFEWEKPSKMGYMAPDRYYPEVARVQRIEGAVELNVTVSPEGQPLSVEIVKGPESLLTQCSKGICFDLTILSSQKRQCATTARDDYRDYFSIAKTIVGPLA